MMCLGFKQCQSIERVVAIRRLATVYVVVDVIVNIIIVVVVIVVVILLFLYLKPFFVHVSPHERLSFTFRMHDIEFAGFPLSRLTTPTPR